MRKLFNHKSVAHALTQVDDGFLFEQFCQNFLAAVIGADFQPAGTIRDRGIDGFVHALYKGRDERQVYQISIQDNSEDKLRDSLIKLRDNEIAYSALFLVTSRTYKNKDVAEDTFADEFGKRVRIYDSAWFAVNIEANDAAYAVFTRFLERHLYAYTEPGSAFKLVDQVADPRLYVFLRQQVDHGPAAQGLNKTLVDTLILYVLKDTDPDAGRLMTRQAIVDAIEALIGFSPSLLSELLGRRLVALSSKRKNRRINHHTLQKAYCLPFDTRVEIQAINLEDDALHKDFFVETENDLRTFLTAEGISVRDCVVLVEKAIGQIFYDQGLELSHFVLGEALDEGHRETNLTVVIDRVVEQSSVVEKNRIPVARALLATIRQAVYRGSARQTLYLQKLSRTYMMLFMLKCDPKVSAYFAALASKLRLYVCTSVLIPALSERFLPEEQRRHQTLLSGARARGVELLINQNIVDELVAHFKRVVRRYEEEFQRDETAYLDDDIRSLYVDEILIRAYYYAKREERVADFRQYIDGFVSYDLRAARQELIALLQEEYGCTYISVMAVDPETVAADHEKLYTALKGYKSDDEKARSDATMILSIYKERQLRSEDAEERPFGYQTWWLSKDYRTYRAVSEVFHKRFPQTCSMRLEFLAAYISIAPTVQNVGEVYEKVFPTFVGVNISARIDHSVVLAVRSALKDHQDKSAGRRKAVLRGLADRLKSERLGAEEVRHYLDEELERVEQSTVSVRRAPS